MSISLEEAQWRQDVVKDSICADFDSQSAAILASLKMWEMEK